MIEKDIYIININGNSTRKWCYFYEFNISKKYKNQSDNNFRFFNMNWGFELLFNTVSKKNWKLYSQYNQDIYKKILERFWFEFENFKDIYENETTILFFNNN